ncbi:MAG: hypothetical protein QME49_09700 [bacterium]|nr:hypothetical protein [bacterium]
MLGVNSLEQVVSLPFDYNKVLKNIVKVFDILAWQAEDERKALLQYCTEQGLIEYKKVGLVDVGYSATIQRALSRLLEHSLAGYYFVTDNLASSLKSSQAICRAYFGEFVHPFQSSLPIQRYSLLMEAVLTAPEGQLICFHRGPSGIEPVFRQPSIAQKRFHTIRYIHEGILRFVRDILDLFGIAALDVEFPKDVIQHCYELVITGELGVGNLQSILSVEDYYCGNAEIPVLDWYTQI